MTYDEWLQIMKNSTGKWVWTHGADAAGKIRYMEWRFNHNSQTPYELSMANTDYLFIFIRETGEVVAGHRDAARMKQPTFMWEHTFPSWLEGAQAIREKLQTE